MATPLEEAFLDQTRQKVNHCINLLQSGNEPEEVLRRLDTIQRNLRMATPSVVPPDVASNLLSIVEKIQEEARKTVGVPAQDESYCAPTLDMGDAHRPKYDITREQLLVLQDNNFTSKEMAKALGVSRSTVTRRLKENGMLQRMVYSRISDQELDALVEPITASNKLTGSLSIQARLKGQGTVLQRQRVRESIQRVDPGGVAVRALALRPTRRRLYHVSGPNALWHLDGYHKLISWKMVIHGAIDGFSRAITFLHASNNNRSETVRDLFLGGTQRFGLPSRVRMDHGGENLDVVDLMNEHRGEGRGSAMQGRSVHNQRIERLWLDVWKDVVNPYHGLFTAMGTPQAEGGLGILNMDNPIHLWALHYVFLPRLNRSLEWFVGQKNHQPLQLFFRGMLERRASTSTAVQDFWEGRSLRSIIEDHPLPDSRQDVPATACPLSEEQLVQLTERIDPLSGPPTDQHGQMLFLQVLQFVANILE